MSAVVVDLAEFRKMRDEKRGVLKPEPKKKTPKKKTPKKPKKATTKALAPERTGNDIVEMLLGTGLFSPNFAQKIADEYDHEVIFRQVCWLRMRRKVRNPLAYLLAAIRADYPPPATRQTRMQLPDGSYGPYCEATSGTAQL